jgi:hypothetical protein
MMMTIITTTMMMMMIIIIIIIRHYKCEREIVHLVSFSNSGNKYSLM